MFAYIWPIALVVLSNVAYQICAKSLPDNINPLASLSVTYLVGALVSTVLYFVLNKDADLFKEIAKVNWVPFALGISIVGLEVGFLYAYKNGWEVSTASIVQSAFLAVALLVVGALLYKEAITWNKLVGMLICLIGLFFINFR